MKPSFAEGIADIEFNDPRHMACHTKLNVIYTSNQELGGISSWKRDAKSGALTQWECKETIPRNGEAGYAATDIILSPDSLFAYVVNLDGSGTNPQFNSVSVFKLDPQTGALSDCIQNIKTGEFVRCISIDGSGSFIYAATSRSNEIHAYKRDKKTGFLEALKVTKSAMKLNWMSSLSN